MSGPHGQHLARTNDCAGDDRGLRSQCNHRSAFLEWLEFSTRTPTFGKYQYGDPPFLDITSCFVDRPDRRPRVIARNRNVAAAPQMKADERDIEQALLGHKTKLHGNVC